MESVAVLYIAIGSYDRFWTLFHSSCERYFLPGMPKTYFVFTDSRTIRPNEKTVVTPVIDEGWPGNTLHRFRFFLLQEQKLGAYTYCYFFNANACLLKTITVEELRPTPEENNLVGLSWRPRVKQGAKAAAGYPFERNPLSTAYIPENKGTTYYQGGFFGGKTTAVLDLIRTLDAQIDRDESKHITAINNDESHLNRYFLDKQPKCLTTEYGRPQEWDQPADPSMVFLQKERVLGSWALYRLKGKSVEYLIRCCYGAFKHRLKQLVKPTPLNHS